MASVESLSAHEVEDLDMVEIDAALLREILEELESDTEDTASNGTETEYGFQPLGGTGAPSELLLEPQNSLPVDGNLIHDYDWVDQMTSMNPPVPCDEVMAWYNDAMVGSIEFDFNGISGDDMAYSCLWDG